MKKVLLTLLLVFFATAGHAEISFDLTGDFFARGSYWKNFNLDPDNNVSYMNVDGETNLYPTIKVGKTELKMRIQMRDEIWGNFYGYETDAGTSVKDFADGFPYQYTDSTDANVQIARLWLRHYFENSFLDVGLRDGGQWGTTFGDAVEARYRVVWYPRTPVGVFVLLYEKRAELGKEDLKDSEDGDFMYYGAGWVTKVGDVFVKPLIIYAEAGDYLPNISRSALPGVLGLDLKNTGIQILGGALALNGDLGPVQFEAEFGMQNWMVEDLQDLAPLAALAAQPGLEDLANLAGLANAKDSTIWSVYLNVWNDLDFGRAGLSMYYASWDDKGGPFGAGWGFDAGEDFESNLILGDWLAIGGVDWQPAQDVLGMSMIKPYIANVKTPIDKLTCGASFAYIMSNQEKTAWEDFSAWEIDANAAYAITDNLTYEVMGGYATLSYDKKGLPYGAPSKDPDEVMLLQHRIKLVF
ncbi:MAG TPA: hypothetical protein ENN34_07240 [Deltaproteobacteria bacterium]|nr:hypothetical protein [Deltaproteobacteria bacterium]